MGRYFNYNIHPFSLAELSDPVIPLSWPRQPRRPDPAMLEALWQRGGFPEPLLQGDERSARQWRENRLTQLIQGDLRDLTRLRELSLVEHLALLLEQRSASTLNYSHLAQDVGASVATISQWVKVLGNLHQGFLLRPYSKKIARSLSREPKWYSRDWSGVLEPGARFETMLACHLLKACDFWTDSGMEKHELFYLRDKAHREVDFLVLKSGQPWLLIEAKKSDTQLSPSLSYFQRQTQAPMALQAVWDLPFEERNCLQSGPPQIVPASTLLGQLL